MWLVKLRDKTERAADAVACEGGALVLTRIVGGQRVTFAKYASHHWVSAVRDDLTVEATRKRAPRGQAR